MSSTWSCIEVSWWETAALLLWTGTAWTHPESHCFGPSICQLVSTALHLRCQQQVHPTSSKCLRPLPCRRAWGGGDNAYNAVLDCEADRVAFGFKVRGSCKKHARRAHYIYLDLFMNCSPLWKGHLEGGQSYLGDLLAIVINHLQFLGWSSK